MVRATWGSGSLLRREGFCLEVLAHDARAESTAPPHTSAPLPAVGLLWAICLATCCSSLLLSVFALVPSEIRVEVLHCRGDDSGSLPEILLVDDSILAHDESHHPGGPVFRRVGYESETRDHLPVYEITLGAIRSAFSLTREQVVVVTTVWGR